MTFQTISLIPLLPYSWVLEIFGPCSIYFHRRALSACFLTFNGHILKLEGTCVSIVRDVFFSSVWIGQLCQIHLLNSFLFTSNELQGLIISALGENLACIVHAESTYFVTIVYAARYPGSRVGGPLSPACFVLYSDVSNSHLYLLF